MAKTDENFEDELIERPETAERLRISQSTLDRMIKRGELPFVRISLRRIAFRRSEIEKYIERQTGVAA